MFSAQTIRDLWQRVWIEVLLDHPNPQPDWDFWFAEARRRFCRRLKLLVEVTDAVGATYR